MNWPLLLLTAGVILVNGWTDAPNAIATAVSTGALSFRRAAALAALCNFLGTLAACLLRPAVAMTLLDLAPRGGGTAALTAALGAVVLWSTLAWRFGIPTSESHALVAGLTGASLALRGSLAEGSRGAWVQVLAGLVLSTLLGMGAGALALRGLGPRGLSPAALRRGQRAGAAAMALLHGAQDGQKFLALLLLAGGLLSGRSPGEGVIPPALALPGAALMALGTALGGRRIIDTLGRDMTALSPAGGLAADLGAGACLLLCTLLGLPVSTTHTKVAAIYGAGRAEGGRGARRGVMGEIALAWCATFPCCGALAWLLARLALG